ncbi:MAG TPA: hypothetical protein VLA12_20905, partial [Planctomycetaceae bacterium]|nr:hypothetical protein [Planctomycetaceae bacterium]
MTRRSQSARWLRLAAFSIGIGCLGAGTVGHAQSDDLPESSSNSKTVSTPSPTSNSSTHQHTNKLIREKSPYL